MAQYVWKRRPKGAPKASIAGKYLDGIANKHGSVTAELLVKVSRHEDSPLHRCFEWDTKKAAYEYQKTQARLILRSIMIVTVTQDSDDDTPLVVPGWVHVPNEPGYLQIHAVVADEDLDRKYKLIILDELKNAKRKCQQYDEFREVCQAIAHVKIK